MRFKYSWIIVSLFINTALANCPTAAQLQSDDNWKKIQNARFRTNSINLLDINQAQWVIEQFPLMGPNTQEPLKFVEANVKPGRISTYYKAQCVYQLNTAENKLVLSLSDLQNYVLAPAKKAPWQVVDNNYRCLDAVEGNCSFNIISVPFTTVNCPPGFSVTNAPVNNGEYAWFWGTRKWVLVDANRNAFDVLNLPLISSRIVPSLEGVIIDVNEVPNQILCEYKVPIDTVIIYNTVIFRKMYAVSSGDNLLPGDSSWTQVTGGNWLCRGPNCQIKIMGIP